MGEIAKYYSGDYGDVMDELEDDNDNTCLYCGSDQGDKCKCTLTINHYGYGIVDRNGNPYWDESCVCQDPEPMQDQVKLMNEDFGLDVMKRVNVPLTA